MHVALIIAIIGITIKKLKKKKITIINKVSVATCIMFRVQNPSNNNVNIQNIGRDSLNNKRNTTNLTIHLTKIKILLTHT